MRQAAKIYATVKTCQDALYDSVLTTEDGGTSAQQQDAIYAEARAERHRATYDCIKLEQASVCGQEAEERAMMEIMKSSERQKLHIEAQLNSMSLHKAVRVRALVCRVFVRECMCERERESARARELEYASTCFVCVCACARSNASLHGYLIRGAVTCDYPPSAGCINVKMGVYVANNAGKWS